MFRASLVVPAYREEAMIKRSLKSIYDYFAEHDMLETVELVVVTADSPDKTQSIVAQEIAMFPHHQHVQPGPKVGKGRDVKVGVLAARGQSVIFCDADLATPLYHIQPMLEQLENGVDVVIGYRNLHTIHQGLRYYVSNVSNTIIQLVLLPGIKDSQCGFKGFRSAAVKTIFARVTIMRWGFDMEVIKIAKEQKMKIVVQHIDDWKDPKLENALAGESTIRVTFKTLVELWQIRIRSWKGLYK